MLKKQVWQYRCEHCGKKNYSARHMGHHETGCTRNPNRTCRFHHNCGGEQRPIVELVAAFDLKAEDRGLAKLREVADDCPMCILAAIRQSGFFAGYDDPENAPPIINFDFKAELAEKWKQINEDKRDRGWY